jgi:hypothetical protein
MIYPFRTDDLTRRRLIVVAVVVIFLVTCLGAYSLLVHGGAGPHVALHDSAPASPPGPVHMHPERRETPGALPPTDDPEQFARLVAEALFNWDTSGTLDDYTGRLLAVADPAGEESPGLVADIANYVPTPQAWLELRHHSTRQRIDIDSIAVPELWPRAVAEAGPDGLLPGTTALTIQGTRHRAGEWEGQPVATAHDVTFTVFIVCRPSYPRCYLLRLSRLDEPLQ